MFPIQCHGALYVRENSIVVRGNCDTKPDYDYADHATVCVYQLKDAAETRVSDIHGNTVFTVKAVKDGDAVKVSVEGAHTELKVEVFVGNEKKEAAKKRILVNQTKADRNKAIRSAVKTSMKKVDAAVAANDKEAAAAALVNAISTIDKAASKGVYHKNNAARKVSNLSKAVNSIA